MPHGGVIEQSRAGNIILTCLYTTMLNSSILPSSGEHFLNDFLVDAPTNITTEVAATSCLIKWSLQKYVREYQITYSETNRNSIKLAKVDGNEDNVRII